MEPSISFSTHSHTSSPNNSRIFYLDCLRAFGCFSIAALHTCLSQWYHLEAGSALWHFNLGGISLFYIGVPLFFMISGALFLAPERHISIRTIWLHTLPHLAVIYLAWSAWFAFSSSGFLKSDFSFSSLYAFLKNCLYGANHQWFLWPLAGLYIIVPLLRKIAAEKRLLQYFLLISFFLAILPVSSHFTVHLALYETVSGWLSIGMIGGYSFYFMAGYYFSAYPPKGKQAVFFYVLGLLGLLSTYLGAWYFRFHNEGVLPMWLAPDRAHSGLFVLAIFIFTHNITESRTPPVFIQKIVTEISRCSFGVYMLHLSFLFPIMRLLNYDPLLSPSLWKVPLIVFLLFVVSIVSSMVLRRIPLLKRLLF